MIKSILIAPDSYKGSLSSFDASNIIADGILSIAHYLRLLKNPLADGGEGTVDVIAANKKCKRIREEVVGPYGQQVQAEYIILEEDNTAIIEMAQASGLLDMKQHMLNPLNASSYGTGQLIKSAAKKGVQKIIITLGGSATVDGGAGMLQALGVKLLKHEVEFPNPISGQDLEHISEVEVGNALDAYKDIEIIIASDVSNPLLGKDGAVYTFAPQKGASDDVCHTLEFGMSSFYTVVEGSLGKSVIEQPGAGAAGGMGAALLAFFDCKLISGINMIFEMTNFENKLKQVDLVITGEGSFDSQSFQGKVINGVLDLARKYDKPVAVFAGRSKMSEAEYKKHGIEYVLSLNDGKQLILETMANAKPLLFSHSVNFAKNILPKFNDK